MKSASRNRTKRRKSSRKRPGTTETLLPGDLARLCGWPELERCRRSINGPKAFIDGANVAHTYGNALRERFGCKSYPLSRGIELVLEALERDGIEAVCVVPRDMVKSRIHSRVCDSCGHWRRANAQRVSKEGIGLLRNDWLLSRQSEGRVEILDRSGDPERDDLELLDRARAEGARGYVVSNDLLRGHRQKARRRGFLHPRRFESISAWKRLGVSFELGGGLSDDTLAKLRAEAGWSPSPLAGDGELLHDEVGFWHMDQRHLPAQALFLPNHLMLRWRSQHARLPSNLD